MEVQFDILALIGVLGAAQAVVVGTALLTIKDLRTRVFGLLLISLGVVMGTILYSHMHSGREPLAAVLVEVAISLIAPVLFFGFVVLVVRHRWRKWIPLCAVIPTVWFLQAAVIGLFGGPAGIWIPPIEVIVAHQVAYTFVCAILVVNAQTDGARVSAGFLRWARLTVFFMFLINCAQGIRLFVDAEGLRNVVPFTSGFVVIALTFIAARHSRVFIAGARPEASAGPSARAGTKAGGRQQPIKYSSSSLSVQESEKVLSRFRHAMEVDRAFLRADLTLDGLAEELGLARTYLSQVINARCERPFLEVVADYRVLEAKRILAEDEASHLTAEAVGSRAGFQSKSAFYAAFRKRAGMAPAAYRRRLQQTKSKSLDRPHQE